MNSFINIAHLKFFCDTVTYSSMSEAAKMNFITQSAISQAINKLEISFGTTLLIQNKQKIAMTEHGQIVFDRSLEIFKILKEASQQISHINDKIEGVVKFATSKSLSMSFFAPTYIKMQKNLPLVDIRIETGNKNYIRTLLKLEEVEFAIVVYDDYNFIQYEKQCIKKGFFNLYHSKKSPKDLINDEIFIDYEESLYIRELKDFLLKNNCSLQIKALAGWELVANFTNLGLGMGFFPDFLPSNNRYPNLTSLPVNLPSFEYEIAAIYNKSTKLSRAACAFIEQFSLE